MHRQVRDQRKRELVKTQMHREREKYYSVQVSWNIYRALYSTRNRHMKPVVILRTHKEKRNQTYI
jgi:uncharacterized protein YjaG (DUF416 family)